MQRRYFVILVNFSDILGLRFFEQCLQRFSRISQGFLHVCREPEETRGALEHSAWNFV